MRSSVTSRSNPAQNPVYARPKVNKRLGRRIPVPAERVVEAIARSAGAKVGMHGAEAARRFGLTTQVPIRTVYTTTGRTRRGIAGGQQYQLMHASPRRMALAGTPAGDALAALLYLGKSEVTPEVLTTVRSRLAPEEFAALRAAVTSMPGWLVDMLHQLAPSDLVTV